jgi:xanthine dehydrogenase accessory factor
MSELSSHLDQLDKSEAKVAVATLVNTRGTTPRKEGAKMLVGEGGRVLGSVTIGGCVDAQVIEESADVLDKNAPRLLELNLGDEEAWEIGLTCGGTIEVFVEPVTLGPGGSATVVFDDRARAHAETGGRAVIVTRLDPPHNGAKLLLLDTGTREGTLGARPWPPASRARCSSRTCAPSPRCSRPPPRSWWSGRATSRCR